MLTADLGVPLGESSCISCGTCIQVCPTGTLIDRKSAYQGRDVTATPIDSICTGCGLGCGVTLMVRDNRIIRIDGDWQSDINGGIICKKGRFEVLEDKRERINQPLARKNGQLVPLSWEDALVAAAQGLKTSPAKAVVSSRLSAEALNIFSQLANALKAETGLLPESKVDPIPPFLGEHFSATTALKNELTRIPAGEATWTETYAVHAGANRRAAEAYGLQGSPTLAGNVLIACGDDDAVVDLSQAGFTVLCASYTSPMMDNADLVLPTAIWCEQEGHYLNLSGHLQKAEAAVKPAETVWSNETVLTALAKALNVSLNPDWETALKVTA